MSETEQPDHPVPPPPPQQAAPAGRVHVLAPGEVVITGLGAG